MTKSCIALLVLLPLSHVVSFSLNDLLCVSHNNCTAQAEGSACAVYTSYDTEACLLMSLPHPDFVFYFKFIGNKESHLELFSDDCKKFLLRHPNLITIPSTHLEDPHSWHELRLQPTQQEKTYSLLIDGRTHYIPTFRWNLTGEEFHITAEGRVSWALNCQPGTSSDNSSLASTWIGLAVGILFIFFVVPFTMCMYLWWRHMRTPAPPSSTVQHLGALPENHLPHPDHHSYETVDAFVDRDPQLPILPPPLPRSLPPPQITMYRNSAYVSQEQDGE